MQKAATAAGMLVFLAIFSRAQSSKPENAQETIAIAGVSLQLDMPKAQVLQKLSETALKFAKVWDVNNTEMWLDNRTGGRDYVEFCDGLLCYASARYFPINDMQQAGTRFINALTLLEASSEACHIKTNRSGAIKLDGLPGLLVAVTCGQLEAQLIVPKDPNPGKGGATVYEGLGKLHPPPPGTDIGPAPASDQDQSQSTVQPYNVGNGVSPPQLLLKVDPNYPEEARKAHVQGTVVLRVTVQKDGSVQNPQVIRALGSGLDEKALEAVKQWHFRPGQKDGQPVDVLATIEVTFRLLPDATTQDNESQPPSVRRVEQ